MGKNLIHLLIVTTILLSCSSIQDDCVESYSIDVNNLSEQNELFEGFQCVKLETRDDNIITNIDKIEFCQNKIFILDKESKTLFFFDNRGNYINKISRFGKGRGEYLSSDDFQIFNDTIFILSRVNKKICLYNSNCEFIKDIILDDWYSNICVIDNNYMYLYSEESNEKMYNFILYDYVNNLYLDKFDKFEENQSFCSHKTPFNRSCNGDILITKQFSNTIFSLKNNRYESICRFEYNTKDKMLDKYAKIPKKDLNNKLLNKSVVKRILGVDINNCKIYMYYDIMFDDIGYRTFISIINTSSGDIKTCRLGDKIDEEIPIIGHQILLTKDYLVSYLPAFVVEDINRSLQLNILKNETICATDNPILMLYKLKNIPSCEK